MKKRATGKDNRVIAGSLVALLLLTVLVGSEDLKDAHKELDNYCEMVELHQTTNGEYGWPDYQKTFNKECK